MKMRYIPSRDELVLIFHPIVQNSIKEVDHFKVWLDDKGTICALSITSFAGLSHEVRKMPHTIQLGGLWKGITINDDDIAQAREELLGMIEEKISL